MAEQQPRSDAPEPNICVIYIRTTRDVKRRLVERAAKEGKLQNDFAVEAIVNYLDLLDESGKK